MDIGKRRADAGYLWFKDSDNGSSNKIFLALSCYPCRRQLDAFSDALGHFQGNQGYSKKGELDRVVNPLFVVIFTLFFFLLFGSPVIFAIGGAGLAYFIVKPGMWPNVYIFAHKFFTGMDSFVFLCIPLFILAGETMGKTGMTDRLVRFSQLIVGRFRGGLAYATILANMIMGGISGSALADLSALGPVSIRMMKKDGYTPEFATAVNTTAALQGPIIPPSIPMVIFASLTNVSVGALFLGGIIPGIMLGVSLGVVVKLAVKRFNFPSHPIEGLNFRLAIKIIRETIWALMMPVIIVGGIISGVFTATEAAAVGVIYSILVGFFVYRELKLKMLWEILNNSIRTTAQIYLIIGFALIISWVFASERVPDQLIGIVNRYHLVPWSFLLILNIFFLFNGCWISDTVQLLLFAPLFTPILMGMGVSPIHFGVVMVVNVMIGLITPPYGTALYLGAVIGKVSLTNLFRESIPFLIACLCVLLLITYIPGLVTWIPTQFGLIGR